MSKGRLPTPDEILIAGVILLVTIGTVMVASAGAFYHHVDDPFHYLKRQVQWVLIAVVVGIVSGSIDYRVYRRLHGWLLVATLVILGLVLVPSVGVVVNNSRRWIGIGEIFRFQPSELAKLTVIISIAAYLTNDPSRTRRFLRGFAPVSLLLFGVFVLILLEPDLGSSVFVLGLGTAVMLLAGMRVHYLLASAVPVVPVLVLYANSHWETIERRLLGFLEPENPAQYQVFHSLIALGGGGWSGVGLGGSTEKLRYLPEAHTDFILAIIGEETGFFGCIGILMLFGAVVWSGAAIAMRARDSFGFLVASGITIALGFQALINVAVVTGSAPTKGMSLPLISFGGSGLCLTMALVGTLVSVARVAREEPPLESSPSPPAREPKRRKPRRPRRSRGAITAALRGAGRRLRAGTAWLGGRGRSLLRRKLERPERKESRPVLEAPISPPPIPEAPAEEPAGLEESGAPAGAEPDSDEESEGIPVGELELAEDDEADDDDDAVETCALEELEVDDAAESWSEGIEAGLIPVAEASLPDETAEVAEASPVSAEPGAALEAFDDELDPADELDEGELEEWDETEHDEGEPDDEALEESDEDEIDEPRADADADADADAEDEVEVEVEVEEGADEEYEDEEYEEDESEDGDEESEDEAELDESEEQALVREDDSDELEELEDAGSDADDSPSGDIFAAVDSVPRREDAERKEGR